MKWRIKDESLQRLESDPGFEGGYSPAVVKSFRKHMQRIDASTDPRDFGGHFERLRHDRNHQYSIRLDQKMRLILEFEGTGEDRTVVIVGIEDYHRRER